MKTINFNIRNVEGRFEIIEKRGYTGRGYRYSLKYFLDEVEVYYCDCIKASKTQISQVQQMSLAIKHMKDMGFIENTPKLEVV